MSRVCPLFPFLLLLILDALAPSPVRAAGPDDALAVRTASALYEGIRTATLDNGLRIYLKPVPGVPSVTTLVVYKVGSADEDKSFTGLSHYLEHLMFKGTDVLMPGDIDRVTFRNGGANNAYTTTDLTAYHFTFPAGQWKPALQIEAQRMRNLRIDARHEFDKEKGAVINELIGNEDSPWELESKVILPLLFGKKSPYGHPVIGEAQHVKDATEKVIKAHYDKWYHPNNAALIVVGAFDEEEVLKEVRKLFGPIPRSKLPERKPWVLELLKRPARAEIVSKFAVPRLLLGYNTVKAGDADQVALDVLEGVLGRGRTSRLYRSLVEGAEVASSVSADHSPGRYPGWMGLYVEVLPGKDRAKVEKLVLAELKKLRDEPLKEEELKRVKHLILARTLFSLEGDRGLADSLARAVTVTDLDFAKSYLPRVQEVTASDIQRVAKKYLDPEKRVTVWSVPPEKKEGATQLRRAGDALGRARRAPEKGTAFDLKKAQRVELDNGLVLLLFENRRLPVVEARVLLREASLLEPDDKLGVATLTGSLLDEGTTSLSGPKIAEEIENVGGVLSLGSSGGSVRVLAPDRKLGLGLLLDCLTRPAFPAEAFARVKAQQLARIGEEETQPEERARQVYNELVYGKHPAGRPTLGTRKTVGALKREDCAAFHKMVFVPGNAILAVVGDFDSKDVIAEVKKLTAGWKRGKLERPKTPDVEKPKEFTQRILTMPEAAQLHFFMGHAGIKRDNPDYYKLLVLDYVLGTGPGFTDRLSSRLRDREGLAYTVVATITSSAGTEPGTFTCYIGTDKENFARVKKEFLEELNRIRDEAPTKAEVQDAKTYLIGSRLLPLSGNGGIAAQLLSIEHYHLGLGYLEEFEKKVAAVTPEDVQTVAKKYLDPKRMVLVAAGPVDQKGEPLKEKEKPKP